MSRTWHRKKEQRKQGSKRFDSSCDNHGSCPWCRGNREHKHVKRTLAEDVGEDIPMSDMKLSKNTVRVRVETDELYTDFCYNVDSKNSYGHDQGVEIPKEMWDRHEAAWAEVWKIVEEIRELYYNDGKHKRRDL